MKNLFLLWCITLSAHVFAVDEVSLILAKAQGTAIYFTCIVTPPIELSQQTFCATSYSTYELTLTALNAPYPKSPAFPNLSPYKWSPYDICRDEISQMVFGDQGLQPYCPTLPI